jgi:hypothetical protein
MRGMGQDAATESNNQAMSEADTSILLSMIQSDFVKSVKTVIDQIVKPKATYEQPATLPIVQYTLPAIQGEVVRYIRNITAVGATSMKAQADSISNDLDAYFNQAIATVA